MAMTGEFARKFSEEWIASWNSHDLKRILSHYAEHIEMSSPMIVQLMGAPTGMLKGKAAIRAYWAKALARLPDLHFDLTEVLVGVSSLVIQYRGPRGPSAEVFWFDAENKVCRAPAHYTG
jgi:ketosteroid isomerase-like protein